MRTIILAAGFLAGGLFAQDAPALPPKLPEIRTQVGMMGETFQFLGGQLVGGEPVKGALFGRSRQSNHANPRRRQPYRKLHLFDDLSRQRGTGAT